MLDIKKIVEDVEGMRARLAVRGDIPELQLLDRIVALYRQRCALIGELEQRRHQKKLRSKKC